MAVAIRWQTLRSLAPGQWPWAVRYLSLLPSVSSQHSVSAPSHPQWVLMDANAILAGTQPSLVIRGYLTKLLLDGYVYP